MARKHNFYLIFNMGLKTTNHKNKTQSNPFSNKQKSLQPIFQPKRKRVSRDFKCTFWLLVFPFSWKRFGCQMRHLNSF